MDGRKNIGIYPAQREGDEYDQDNGDVDGDDVLDGFFQIGVYLSAHGNGIYHFRQIIF